MRQGRQTPATLSRVATRPLFLSKPPPYNASIVSDRFHGPRHGGVQRRPRLPLRALAQEFDINRPTPAFLNDPYTTYFALQTFAPVHRSPDGSVVVTRYADVRAVCMQPDLYSSRRDAWLHARLGDGPLAAHYASAIMFSDPPAHARVRAVLDHACLNEALIRALRPGLEVAVERVLDDLAGRGAFDAMADFAVRLPAQVIGTLLGIPPEERALLRNWSVDMLAVLEPDGDALTIGRGAAALRDCTAFLRELFGRRRAADGPARDDVLGRLMRDVESGVWSEYELLQNTMLLMNAGQETIANTIGNALHALARFPGEQDRLLAEPDLMDAAIEEFLRYDCAIQFESRTAVAPATLGGESIAPGTLVYVCLGAANHDAEVFDQPDRLDITRDPNPHLAFATGIHRCIGGPIARMAASVALSAFLLRFPRYELAHPPVPGRRARYRGFLSLPVRLP